MLKDIRSGIASGELAPGDRLPSEGVLATKYRISVNSVRRGMDELVRQGLVARRRGSGTYILEPPRDRHVARADTVLLACAVQHVPSHPYFGKRDQALRMRLSELGWKSEHLARLLPPDQIGHTVWHQLDTSFLLQRIESDKSVAGVVVDRLTADSVAAALGGRLPCMSLSEHSSLPYADYRWSDELARAVAVLGRSGARRVHIVSGHAEEELKLAVTAGCALGSAWGGRLQADFTKILHPSCSKTMHEAFFLTRRLMRSNRERPDGIVMGSDIHAQGVLDALADLPADCRRTLCLAAFTNKGGSLRSAIPFIAFEADGEAAGWAGAELLNTIITSPGSAPVRAVLACTVFEPYPCLAPVRAAGRGR